MTMTGSAKPMQREEVHKTKHVTSSGQTPRRLQAQQREEVHVKHKAPQSVGPRHLDPNPSTAKPQQREKVRGAQAKHIWC